MGLPRTLPRACQQLIRPVVNRLGYSINRYIRIGNENASAFIICPSGEQGLYVSTAAG